jgi:hypothetical protein
VIASFVLPGIPGKRSRPCRSQCGTVQRAIFHLLDEPAPTLADPVPRDDPLPGAYELHLPSDNVTIWYVVALHEGQEIISIQLVRLDT